MINSDKWYIFIENNINDLNWNISASFSHNTIPTKLLPTEIQMNREKVKLSQLRASNKLLINSFINKTVQEEEDQKRRYEELIRKQKETIDYLNAKSINKLRNSSAVIQSQLENSFNRQKSKEMKEKEFRLEWIKKEQEEIRKFEQEFNAKKEQERKDEIKRIKRSEKLRKYIEELKRQRQEAEEERREKIELKVNKLY